MHRKVNYYNSPEIHCYETVCVSLICKCVPEDDSAVHTFSSLSYQFRSRQHQNDWKLLDVHYELIIIPDHV